MHASSFAPHPALRPYVQNYLYYETGIEDQWAKVNTSPTLLPVLAFSLDAEGFIFKEYGKFEPLTFCGQLTQFTNLHFLGRLRAFHIFFHPTGAYRLFGIPMNEMRNSMLNLSDMLGSRIRELKEKLLEQNSLMKVKQLIEVFLLDCLARRKQKENSIQLTYTIEQLRSLSFQRNVIKTICKSYGYSISRLERHSREMVGIGPKMIQRIARFNSVLDFVNRNRPPYKWAQIAFQFGYADQMHFIREFCWFYGTNPGELDKFSGMLNLSMNSSGEEESAKTNFRVFK